MEVTELMRTCQDGVVRIEDTSRDSPQPLGTGFFSKDTHTIITNFHVVGYDIGQEVQYRSSLQVRWNNGLAAPCEVEPHPGSKLGTALYWNPRIYDYAILKSHVPGTPLELGCFDKISPGDDILTAGYPFGIDTIIFNHGMISSIQEIPCDVTFNNANGIISPSRKVCYLDSTQNRGNSGGPVFQMITGQVIGIASFGINPIAFDGERMLQYIAQAKKAGSVQIMGVDQLSLWERLVHTLMNNSVGISGMISIEYAMADLASR